MNKTVQAKHVPELPILRALDRVRWMTHRDGGDPTWNLPAAVPELRAFPEKVLIRKLAAMDRRGLIDGCDCGCRGDWVLLKAGEVLREASE